MEFAVLSLNNSKLIIQRAIRVYQFLTKEFGYKEDDVIIFGRSIGSGPAVQLAALTDPCLLILMSAYTSIRNVARDIWKWFKWCIKERFNSIIKIKQISCPMLYIHGELDTVIRWTHSKALYKEAMVRDKICELRIRSKMDHNTFNFHHDIVAPIEDFMKSNNITTKAEQQMKPEYKQWKLSRYGNLMDVPPHYDPDFLSSKFEKNKKSWWSCIIF